MPWAGFEPTIPAFERAKAVLALDRAASVISWTAIFFPLWLYSPIQVLTASMILSVSLQLLDLGQSVGFLGRVISSSQGLHLYTNTVKRTHSTHTLNIHALSGIRTQGRGVRASEDSSCLRPLDHRDRQAAILKTLIRGVWWSGHELNATGCPHMTLFSFLRIMLPTWLRFKLMSGETFVPWLQVMEICMRRDIREVCECCYYYYYYYYGSTALCWALAAFSVSWSYTQSAGLLGRGISQSQGLYLQTEQHKNRINAHNTDIHALSGIRTHDPSVRASEDISCLRPGGHCDRREFYYGIRKLKIATWRPRKAFSGEESNWQIIVIYHLKSAYVWRESTGNTTGL
jgi:hypothetical protein